MNTRFLDACRGLPVDRTPVWLMRQAGRYLPAYRRIRSTCSFLELCKTPELAAEVTIQPVDILGVDAAILFSDILIPLEPMGMRFDFVPGPLFEDPVRTIGDVESLRVPSMDEELPFVLETIRILRRELEGRVPLIGFGGAPFTLACYMVEGQGSKGFATVKRMMYSAPEVFAALMDKLATMLVAYLGAQIAAGVQAVQVFDTWGGILSPSDYERHVLPYTARVLSSLDAQVPVIHFVKGAGAMLELVRRAGGDVIGLDWHVSLGRGRDLLGPGTAVQGNLDPTVLYGPRSLIEAEVKRILEENGGRPGHVFNLGHGILPDTPPENAMFMVDCVHRLSDKTGG